jgi:hypothetical protein
MMQVSPERESIFFTGVRPLIAAEFPPAHSVSRHPVNPSAHEVK